MLTWVGILLMAGLGLLSLILGIDRAVVFWQITGILFLLLAAIVWAGYSQDPIARLVRRILATEVPIPTRTDDPRELYYRPFPAQLSRNWVALVLGPFWYLAQGLWVHAVILFSLVLVSGGVLIPVVWLYCGLKANEDLIEFNIARRSVY